VRIWESLKGGVILGGRGFCGEAQTVTKGAERRPGGPRQERPATSPTFEKMFARVKDKSGWDDRIYEAVIKHGYRLAEMGNYLGLH